MKILSALFAIALLSSNVATAGKAPAKNAHAHKQMHQLVQVKVDLDFKPHKRSSFGKLLGYDPAEVHVHQNDQIQFVNVDDTAHTATGMSYTGQVAPAHYQFVGDPTKASGRIINATEWSTGNLRAHGGKSQVFIAKNVGHYFYACSYHLGQGQIGIIVVGP